MTAQDSPFPYFWDDPEKVATAHPPLPAMNVPGSTCLFCPKGWIERETDGACGGGLGGRCRPARRAGSAVWCPVAGVASAASHPGPAPRVLMKSLLFLSIRRRSGGRRWPSPRYVRPSRPPRSPRTIVTAMRRPATEFNLGDFSTGGTVLLVCRRRGLN